MPLKVRVSGDEINKRDEPSESHLKREEGTLHTHKGECDGEEDFPAVELGEGSPEGGTDGES